MANQIAAGEVIQRPASVIKELVENAVDAGATDILVVVTDAGKTMIQVIDNGKGMTETDARMAFERHATSKIRNADDLFSLHTMGFRGEALPSICAISEVDLKTRQADAPIGTHLVIEGSKVICQEPGVCEKGTVFTVKRLFYNVPARRKFLKSDNVELSNIMREFERLALVNNNIRMRLDTGTRHMDLRAGTLLQRIGDIWKNNINMQLIPVDVDTSMVKIEGYISRPEFARRRNPLQFLFVNGRHMRHPYFHKAVMSCYETLIAADTQPCYFLRFTVDPQTIDVNIHPTKSEIKFEYEQQIWPILAASIRAALGKYSAVPSIDFTVDAIPVRPAREGEMVVEPRIENAGGFNPFATAVRKDREERPARNWESLYESFKRESNRAGAEGRVEPAQTALDMPSASPHLFADEQEHDISSMCLQYAEKYIITTYGSDLLIIDQHRAHVRILYEEYLGKVSQNAMVSQSVMFPEILSLDASQQEALAAVTDDISRMGFCLEYDSDNKWAITAVPAMIKHVDVKDMILRILDSVTEDSTNYGKDEAGQIPLINRIALVMARSQAIKGGVRLSENEMEHLISRLFALPGSSLTPSGSRIYSVLTHQQIEKMLNPGS